MKKLSVTTILFPVCFLIFAASAAAEPPSMPSDVYSTSHPINIPSFNKQISIRWKTSTDADGDLKGYAIKWDNVADTVPWEFDSNSSPKASATSAISDSLSGGSWYFHIRAVDNEGKFSDPVHSGPHVIVTQPYISDVNPNTADNASETEITIKGTDFTQDDIVRIGDTDMGNVVFVSSEELRATVPAGLTSGPYDIQVINPGSTLSYKAENAFTVTSSGTQTPSLDAGADMYAVAGAEITLGGSLTSGSGDNWVYTWNITDPASSNAVLSNNDTLTPVFTPDESGLYTLRLTATETGGTGSLSDSMNITVYSLDGTDVSGDGSISLADAVLAIRVLSGFDTTDEIQSVADIDNDGKTGVSEIICILRVMSSAR